MICMYIYMYHVDHSFFGSTFVFSKKHCFSMIQLSQDGIPTYTYFNAGKTQGKPTLCLGFVAYQLLSGKLQHLLWWVAWWIAFVNPRLTYTEVSWATRAISLVECESNKGVDRKRNLIASVSYWRFQLNPFQRRKAGTCDGFRPVSVCKADQALVVVSVSLEKLGWKNWFKNSGLVSVHHASSLLQKWTLHISYTSYALSI